MRWIPSSRAAIRPEITIMINKKRKEVMYMYVPLKKKR